MKKIIKVTLVSIILSSLILSLRTNNDSTKVSIDEKPPIVATQRLV